VLQRDRAHRVESVVLHLRVQRRGLHPQQSCCLSLIPVAAVERALDQFDLIALDLLIEIDALIIEFDQFVAIAIGSQLELQSFNLTGQRLRKMR